MTHRFPVKDTAPLCNSIILSKVIDRASIHVIRGLIFCQSMANVENNNVVVKILILHSCVYLYNYV